MLLPEIEMFVRLAGFRSLGQLLLGPEVRIKGGNGAAHRILREVMAGNPVTQPRLMKLIEAVYDHATETGRLPSGAEILKLPDVPELPDQDPPYRRSLVAWRVIEDYIPESRMRTRECLHGLTCASASLHQRMETEGPVGVVRELKRPDWGPASGFVSSIIAEIEDRNEVPEGGSAALKVYGLLCMMTVFLAESYENDPRGLRECLTRLFMAEDGVVHPSDAITGYLKRSVETDDAPGKMDFISRAFANSDVRDVHRYFEGKTVPTYQKVIDAIERSHPGESIDYLESRKLGALLLMLVAKSARYLAARPGLSPAEAAQPYQAVYDEFTAVLARHGAGPIVT